MKLKKEAAIDLLTITSMGVRMTPVNRQPVHTSQLFEMRSTSAESNVLNISASLGLHTKVLTKFTFQSPIAAFIKGELRKRNIQFEGKEVEPDGPWGVRHQINMADGGFGLRGPQVYNDRAGEVGRTIAPEDFDFEKIFEQEGVRVLHLSGLIAAMSDSTGKACIQGAKKAKGNGTLVSFDLNYRESFWTNNKTTLRKTFHEIASLADVLIGNEEDFQLALGIEGPREEKGKLTGKKIVDKIEAFKEMVDQVSKKYPNASMFANTLRQVESANSHQWGAILRADHQWFVEKPRLIDVYDRIGGGDGFVGGLLYGVLKNWKPEKALQFAWATGALATTMAEDYATPLNEEQVWSIYQGNARVKR